MKAFSLSLLLLAGCASARPSMNVQRGLQASASTVEPGYVVALSGADNGVGHGCPISEHYMLTAAHMTRDFFPGVGFIVFPLRWTDSFGGYGTVDPILADTSSDLALMHSEHPFGVWYPLAKEAPKVGSTVYIVGYDYGRDHFKQPKLFTTKVLTESAGRIYFEKDAEPGSSGSCSLNEQMEILSINNTIEGSPNDSMLKLGGSVAVYGDWLPEAMREAMK